ncbi:hypothetical protein OBBRIDRAFT_789959 [Obba rivulosa]|uniref:Phosphatidate cytidylyltransferase n=1 Tax=Obba rivulosa TaxID=1052685 RepID=A0A8E2DQD8_9APHY|nr:hypothetical protein OBBRIDRAFT_789959 [Obba rivulosa]
MSNPQAARPSFASKIAFEALGVESGDESEEELIESTPSPAAERPSADPPKPSKSAIKKAKAIARQERLQQAKALRAAQRAQAAAQNARLAQSSPSVPEAPHPESGSLSDSVVVVEIPQDESVLPPEGVQTEPLAPLAPKANGAAHTEPERKEEAHAPLANTAAVSSIVPPSASIAQDEPVPQPELAEEAPKSIAKYTNGHVNGDAKTKPEKQEQVSQQGSEQVTKRQNMLTRTLWTFIMIGGFILLLLMGHAYMIALVMLCQTMVYREVTSLFSLKKRGSDEEVAGRDPWSKTLNWYFFAVTNYFLYGESIIYYFKHIVFSDPQRTVFAMNHRIISFTLYTIGFVGFVLSLKRGYLKQQFGLFCWVHMTLLLIVVSSHFIVNNILEGLIWFWVPASLVICNDVFAYVWGITIGRTPLIKLSPKKTVEGFVGAFFSTLVFSLLWGTWFMRYQYMICPVQDLGVSAFSGLFKCEPNSVFVWREANIWPPVSAALSTLLGRPVVTIPYAPFHLHLLLMACFASLVAPFGGFFASGFKRAFGIKDFGHSIPGHGGMTDRMDCQFLMGVFTYVYYSSLIRQHHVSVGELLQQIVSGLTVEQQLELISDLKRYLEGQGIAVPL